MNRLMLAAGSILLLTTAAQAGPFSLHQAAPHPTFILAGDEDSGDSSAAGDAGVSDDGAAGSDGGDAAAPDNAGDDGSNSAYLGVTNDGDGGENSGGTDDGAGAS